LHFCGKISIRKGKIEDETGISVLTEPVPTIEFCRE
jgi:hypothetical protein